MTIERVDDAREKGIALVYVGIFLVPILLCTGLAIDLGRGYLVRVALAKAVDAAALAAARNITADSATATAVANNIFNANFPPGFLGVSSLRNPPGLKFDIGSDGSHIITVSSTATLPTTFMRMAKFDTLTVSADATATRRLVDMSFVIDRSGSLQGAFSDVKAAAMQFVGYFDTKADRIALITFSSGTTVAEPMGSERGFDLAQIDADIAATKPNGETATAEALYQAWDQLRAVPYGSQSGLRIVVLFTDGTPNSFPGKFQVMARSARLTTPKSPGTAARRSTPTTRASLTRTGRASRASRRRTTAVAHTTPESTAACTNKIRASPICRIRCRASTPATCRAVFRPRSRYGFPASARSTTRSRAAIRTTGGARTTQRGTWRRPSRTRSAATRTG